MHWPVEEGRSSAERSEAADPGGTRLLMKTAIGFALLACGACICHGLFRLAGVLDRVSDRLANAEKQMGPFLARLEIKLDTVDSLVRGIVEAMNRVVHRIGALKPPLR